MVVKEAAARLEISQATVYGLVAAGKLHCYRIGLGRGRIPAFGRHLPRTVTRLAAKHEQNP